MIPRSIPLAGALAIAACASLAASCSYPDRPPEVDLLAALPTAERRAGSDIETAVRSEVVTVAGDARPALVLRTPARVTWPVELPIHADFRTAAVVLSGATPEVRVRVGLSDGRTYEDAGRYPVTPTWQPLVVDLRRFSEWKISVFYQPLFRSWRLVVNAEGAVGAVVALDHPRLTRP